MHWYENVIWASQKSGVDEVTGSLRKAAIRNERIDGVFYYLGLMVSMVRFCLPQDKRQNQITGYKPSLCKDRCTTKAPTLSAGLMKILRLRYRRQQLVRLRTAYDCKGYEQLTILLCHKTKEMRLIHTWGTLYPHRINERFTFRYPSVVPEPFCLFK